ncbi:hypothetical protein CYMTET_37931 [Cymbomonas tetramitiformis]|uniref:Uncharacterized protein n=1 Tax=Cymbomonas tetramitiformis TaxID=36881 RepID=A0AAE0F5Y8_9CHLO|nr:hypothetical protein CYMTET_37931 [Cymbomonas tetramitiformis]
MDVEAELQQLRRDVTAVTEVSMVQASFTPPVSAVVAATAAIDAPSYCIMAPTDEFTGGIDVLPPPERPRTVEMGAHSMGLLPEDAIEPVIAAFQAAALSGGADTVSGGPVIPSRTSTTG